VIAGIGVDIVDLARFEEQIARTPKLLERLFAESERALPVRSLAGRFAAKEALVKALGRREQGMRWADIAVVNNEHGDPDFDLRGDAPAVVAAQGIRRLHLSITHDAGVACAFVVAEDADA
jgi:holo-[acyl-carrier protein] synthase